MNAPKNNSGSALFIVLGCVALMTLLVVAFLGSSMAERSTSNFFAKEVNSKLLSENAINIVMAQLRTATKSISPGTGATVAWASQPGMIRTFNASGNPDSYYKLYSGDTMVGQGAYDSTAAGLDAIDNNWLSEPDLYTDLNEAVNSRNPIVSAYDANGNPLATMTAPGHSGSVLTYKSAAVGPNPDIEGFYVDTATAPADANNQVPMPLKWLYILSDGTQVIPTVNSGGGVNVPLATAANPIVGRIAFWTDDETGKVNINTASEGSSWDTPLTWATEDYGSYLADNATVTSPYGMATAVPAGGEYQRIPGHPATTCLSTVFGSILPVPVPPFLETGSTNSYDNNLAPYFTLTPRYAPGGSKAGTRASFNSADVNYDAAGFLLPPSYRLYTSPDELMFDPQRVPVGTANANVDSDAAGVGISPLGGRTAIAMNQNFFGETQFFLTADSKAPEETLFNTPRISLWPIQTDVSHARNVKDNLLAFCSTINRYPYYFQRAGFYASSVTGTFAPGGPAGSANGSSQDMAIDGGGQTNPLGDLTYGDPTTPTAMSTSSFDGDVHRNLNLLAYLRTLTSADPNGTILNIPGFGGSLGAKYTTKSSFSGNRDIDQILVDMFDYIRSTVNTYSLGYTPQYSYTPMTTAGGVLPGMGTSLPVQLKINGNPISGLGRITTIGEVALVFMPARDMNRPISAQHPLRATGYLDNTTFGTDPASTPPYKPTAGADGLPDDVADSAGHYDRIGDPQTTNMRAFLIIKPIGIMSGSTMMNPNLRYSVAISGIHSGVSDFEVNFNPSPSGSITVTAHPITGAPDVWIPLGFPDGAWKGTNQPGSNSGSSAVCLMNNSTFYNRSPMGFGWSALCAPIPNITTSKGRGQAGQTTQTWDTPSSNGDLPPTASPNTGNALVYPFMGRIIDLPAAANPSNYAPAGGLPIRSNPVNTFTFSGGEMSITVTSGFPTTGSRAPVVQTVVMNWPTINSLPIPSWSRSNPLDNGFGVGVYGGLNTPTPYMGVQYTNPLWPAVPQPLQYYTQVFFGNPSNASAIGGSSQGDIGFIANRFGDVDISGTSSYYNFSQLIQRGDTVRSMVLNPDCLAVKGDTRIIANMPVVPESLAGFPVYTYLGTDAASDSTGIQINPPYAWKDYNYTQFHALVFDGGNYYTPLTRVTSTGTNVHLNTPLPADMTGYPPQTWINYSAGHTEAGQGSYGGALFANATYNYLSSPLVTPELSTSDPSIAGAYMDTTGGHTLAGDWTTGVGNAPDGPLVAAPDEGYQSSKTGGYQNIYYMTYGGVVAGQATTYSSESFSPNREIASPVMFGTLPACVQSGQPWRTLLFCANPATGTAKFHPGFGTVSPGGATAGPNDSAPYQDPPDHLFLDLFWMPVVDPYAISTPFATAGKINMNYQIEPFTYIHRSTAVRAVMKSVGLIALPAAASQKQYVTTGSQYKSGFWHFQNIVPAQNDNYRYNINLDETIDADDSGFQARFANHDIFRCASEICNIFLVPQAIPGNSYASAPAVPPTTYPATAAWWNKFPLTGDNAREAPYNKIYPRLTTKSNSFQVHYRVQTLVKNHRVVTGLTQSQWEAIFDTSRGDAIGGEYRGSAIIERYIDPNDKTLPDFAIAFRAQGTTLDNFYRFRVVRTKSFNP